MALAVEAKAQDINSIAKFTSDLHNLLELLGKEEVEIMAPGTAFKIYKASGTLSSAEVAEKAEIPDSGIGMGDATVVELTYKKYRNLVSIEKIGKLGYDIAVGGANTETLKQVQKGVRKSIIEGLSVSGSTAKKSGTSATLQKQVADVFAELSVVFEDEEYTPVFFANPYDVADYLATANITVQEAYGIKYLQNFMGIGTLIIDSNITKNSVYGSAMENLKVVAASVASIPGMDLATDETGIIAIHNGAEYKNAALETVIYSGLQVLPVFADRIVVSTRTA